MNKKEFLSELKKGLAGIPKADLEERLNFYSEMIDDRIEDGYSEESAVLEIGNTETIISQIIADIPFTKLVKEKVKPKHKLLAWEILFLVLGSPIWLSVLIAFFAVIISVYVAVWSVIISFWAVFAALLGTAVGGILLGVISIFHHNAVIGVAVIGLALFCMGLSVFAFYGSKAATKGIIFLTKKVILRLKNSIVKKEAV